LAVIFGSGLFDRGFGFWTPSEVGKRHRRARGAWGSKLYAKLDKRVGQRVLRHRAAVVVEDEVDLGLDVAQRLLHWITVFAHWVSFSVNCRDEIFDGGHRRALLTASATPRRMKAEREHMSSRASASAWSTSALGASNVTDTPSWGTLGFMEDLHRFAPAV
jgi:hypothetical protein